MNYKIVNLEGDTYNEGMTINVIAFIESEELKEDERKSPELLNHK